MFCNGLIDYIVLLIPSFYWPMFCFSSKRLCLLVNGSFDSARVWLITLSPDFQALIDQCFVLAPNVYVLFSTEALILQGFDWLHLFVHSNFSFRKVWRCELSSRSKDKSNLRLSCLFDDKTETIEHKREGLTWQTRSWTIPSENKCLSPKRGY